MLNSLGLHDQLYRLFTGFKSQCSTDHTIYLHIKNDTLRKVRAEYIKFWSLYINILHCISHVNMTGNIHRLNQHPQQGRDSQKNLTS